MADTPAPLSEREIEVLKLVATGVTNQQIARTLVISPNTVKVHLRNIFEKLGVQSRTEATLEAVRRGWVTVANGTVSVGQVVSPNVVLQMLDMTAAPEGAVHPEEQAVEAGAERGSESPEILLASGTPEGNGAVTAVIAPDVRSNAVSDDRLVADRPIQMETPAVSTEKSVHELQVPGPQLRLWQRVYMLVAAFVVVTLMAMPWWLVHGAPVHQTPLSDVGQLQSPPAQRVEATRWTGLAPLVEARSRLALAAYSGKLYAIGGETAAGITNRVAVYDPLTNRWSDAAPKPTAVSNIGGVALGERIFVPGGTTTSGNPTNALEAYDPQGNAWEAHAPLPTALAAYAMTVAGGRLVLFGGWDGLRYRTETYLYDPVADRWTTGTALPMPRAFAAAAVLEDLVYVVGGYDGEHELTTVTVYNPALEGTGATPWSDGTPLTLPRGGLGVAVVGSRLYAIGGGWTQPLAYNEQFDIKTGAWSHIGTPVLGQWRGLGLTALGQRVYAVGGWSNGQLAFTEEYAALVRQLIPMSGKGS